MDLFIRKVFFAFCAVIFVSGLVFGQSLPGLSGLTGTPAPAPAPASQDEHIISPESAAELLTAADREGSEAFTNRTGATHEEYVEYLQLLAHLSNSADLEDVRNMATPELRREAARIEGQIRDFKLPDITPENSLAIFDEARTSARMAKTWTEIISDFSKSELAREQQAFSRLRSLQQVLSDLQAQSQDAPRQQWLVKLQEVRVSAAWADYQSLQNSSLRDADVRMEQLRAEFDEMIIKSIRDHVQFPESVLRAKLDAISARHDPVVETGKEIAERLNRVGRQLSSADSGSVMEFWLTARVNSLQRQIEANNFERLLLEVRTNLWQERYRIWNGATEADFIAARKQISDIIRNLQTWQPLVTGRLREVRRVQTEVLETAPPEAGAPPSAVTDEFARESEVINALGETYGAAQNVAEMSQLDILEREAVHGISKRFERTMDSGFDMLGKAWGFELFELKDTYTVNNQVFERNSSVTVGMLVTALLLLGIGAFFSSRFCKWLAHRLKQRFHLEDNTAVMVEKFTHYTMVVAFLLMALGIVKIPLTIFALLGGATAIAIGFGAQQLFNNLISGVILLFERPIRIGDRIELDVHTGTVTAIGTRCSRLRRADGVEILIPNSVLLQNTLTNWTLSDKFCRQELLVGVAYGCSVEKAAEIVRHELDTHENVLQNPQPMVLFNDFGDNALIIRALYWIDSGVPNAVLCTPSDLRFAIYRKLDEAGIGIPFPQRDVHIDASRPIPVEITTNETPSKGVRS